MNPFRVLILIVAYNAEKTLAGVLARLPRAALESAGCTAEILILDDCSSDNTFAESVRHETIAAFPVTILRNPANLGYGGNLKVGFHFALTHGFDAVALLHGDGEYAPERLPDLLAPLAQDAADAVIGSRFLPPRTPGHAPLPAFRRLGNRLLTALENRLVGTRLTDAHSGYRAYASRALRRLPFEANDNALGFDTDILIQLHRVGARLREVPVPAFHGAGVTARGGIAAGWRALGACLHSRLHGLGIFYHRKFDLEEGNEHYLAKLHFASSHSAAVAAVAPGDRVLDLGCGPGLVSGALRAKGAYVVGVDVVVRDAMRAACDVAIQANLNAFDWSLVTPHGPYNKILALDIVEHLHAAEDFFQAIRREPALVAAELVLSVPNVAFLPIRLMLLAGQFNHGKRGILDRTHTRFYTFRTLRSLLLQNGYDILELRGIPAPFPLALGDTPPARALLALNRLALRLLPGLCSYQIFCRLRPKPGLDALLARAVTESARTRETPAPATAARPGATEPRP